jgi:hypothetical protein
MKKVNPKFLGFAWFVFVLVFVSRYVYCSFSLTLIFTGSES